MKVIFYLIIMLLSPILWASELHYKSSQIPSIGSLGCLIIAFILMGAVIAIIFIRKRTPANSKDKINLLAQQRLPPKTGVYIIAYQQQKWLIVDNGQSINTAVIGSEDAN